MSNIINNFEITNDFTITDDNLQVKTNGAGSLDISGNIIIGSSISDNAKLIVKNTNNSIIELKANNSDQIETTKSITNKSGVLEFTSNASSNTCLYEFNVGDNDSLGFMNSNGNNKPGIVFGGSGTGSLSVNDYSNAQIFYSTGDGALNLTGEKLIFNTSSGDFTNLFKAMIIDTNGNVGMGTTTTPSVSLDVGGTDAIRIPYGTTAQQPQTNAIGCIRYNTDNSSYEGFGAGSTWGSLGGVKDVNGDTYISAETTPSANNDQLKFYTGDSERMIIDSNGKVGIGTSSPESKLDISGGHLMIADKTNAKETGIVELYTDDNKAGCLLGTYKMEESPVNFINNGTQTVSPGAVSKISTNWNRWADSTNLIYKSTTSTVGFECNVGVATGQSSSYVYCGLRTADDIDRSSTNRNQNITYAFYSVSTGGSTGQRYMRAYYKGTNMISAGLYTTGWAYASGKYEMKVDPTSQIVSIYYNGGLMYTFPTALTSSNYPIRVMVSVYSGRIFTCKVVTPGYTPLSVHNERAINLSAESINFYTHGASTTNHGYTALDDINTDINNSSPILSINDSVSTFSGSIKIDNPGIIWLGSYIKHLPTSENTYIGFPDVNTISFGTNSARRMTIQPDGNVGIGTTSPSDLLTVGNNAISDTGLSTSMAILAPGENADAILYFGTQFNGGVTNAKKTAIIAGGIDSFSRAKLHFCLNNNGNSNTSAYHASVNDSRMTIQPDGKVGIGTTSPHKKLVIFGSDATLRIDSNTSGNKTTKLQIVHSGTTTISASNPIMGLEIQYDSNITPARTYFGHYNGSTTFNKHMTIYRTNGNVGIGTTSPGAKLDVQDTVPCIRLTDNRYDYRGALSSAIDVEMGKIEWYSQDGSWQHITPNLPHPFKIAGISVIAKANNGSLPDCRIGFFTGNDGSVDEKMTIQPDGNVGIGAANAQGYKLYVNGTMRVTGTITCTQITGNAGTASKVYVNTPGSGGYYIYYGSEATGYTNVRSDTGLRYSPDNDRLYGMTNLEATNIYGTIRDTSQTDITSVGTLANLNVTGDVGIGKTNPDYKLEIELDGWGTRAKLCFTRNDRVASNPNHGGGQHWTYQGYRQSSNQSILWKNNANPTTYDHTINDAAEIDVAWEHYAYRNTPARPTGTAIIFRTRGGESSDNLGERMRIESSGNLTLQGGIQTGGTSFWVSDDRLKHNEIVIGNAIETINKLTAKKYFKTKKMYEPDKNFELDASGNPVDGSGNLIKCHLETGFIAQEVLKIPELSYLVNVKEDELDMSGNVVEKVPLALNYQDIFVLNVQATQEIDKIQQAEKTKLEAAETEINSLKNSNAVLLNKIATIESQYYNLQQQVQTLINNQ
tara:strand:- start:48 stop:4100 length:4053 start_codon:yes stop_codon:yes gene_type:complete